MATGIEKLRKVQWGPETTGGTAVAGTMMWRGPGASIDVLDDIQFVREDVGNFGEANRTVKVSQGAQIAIPETIFTFEQFPLFCQSGVKSQQTGVADGGGSGLIYTFAFPTTAVNTIKTWTIEAGDNEEVSDMDFGFCPEFQVRGEPDAAVMMGGIMRGQASTPGQSFAALSAPTVNSAVFNLSKLYLDAAGGTIGSTQVAGTILGYRINVRTGLVPMSSADGSLVFYDVEQGGWEITADITFRHNSTADTEHANWLAQTARLMEITLEGADLATAGTDYSVYTARFQLPGKWTRFAPFETRNGVNILTGTFMAKYDPTAAIGPSIIVVNETASYWA